MAQATDVTETVANKSYRWRHEVLRRHVAEESPIFYKIIMQINYKLLAFLENILVLNLIFLFELKNDC